MDMGTSSMMGMASSITMNMATTATATAASATSSMAAMSMGGDSSCKISMLWNWYTIDSCFIAESWHITSNSMFAGSCIGVILLVMTLEIFRRLGKEYDRYLVRQHQRSQALAVTLTHDAASKDLDPSTACNGGVARASPVPFRPSILQQAVRATFHMVQFAIAYFVMLLAMYYNGYIIICIFIGAWLGCFVFSWETVGMGGPREEVTVCCG